jgi:hypothetical protein
MQPHTSGAQPRRGGENRRVGKCPGGRQIQDTCTFVVGLGGYWPEMPAQIPTIFQGRGMYFETQAEVLWGLVGRRVRGADTDEWTIDPGL